MQLQFVCQKTSGTAVATLNFGDAKAKVEIKVVYAQIINGMNLHANPVQSQTLSSEPAATSLISFLKISNLQTRITTNNVDCKDQCMHEIALSVQQQGGISLAVLEEFFCIPVSPMLWRKLLREGSMYMDVFTAVRTRNVWMGERLLS